MKILGIDFGTKYVGFALSDPFRSIAFPFAKSLKKEAITDILKIIEEENISLVVLGLPISLKGHDTEMSQKVKLFKEKLEKVTNIEVVLQDERLTSSFIGKQLTAQGINQKKQREIKDSLEATQILQSYLDKIK
jgi:putative holliday junction resolvase